MINTKFTYNFSKRATFQKIAHDIIGENESFYLLVKQNITLVYREDCLPFGQYQLHCVGTAGVSPGGFPPCWFVGGVVSTSFLSGQGTSLIIYLGTSLLPSPTPPRMLQPFLLDCLYLHPFTMLKPSVYHQF